MGLYAVTFLLSAALTLLFTPVARRIALKLGAIDKPSKRKIHKKLITRFGGLSIYLSFIVSIVIGIFISKKLGIVISHKELSTLIGVLYGASLVTLIGLVDDLKGISAFVKLIGQIIAALVAVYFGAQIFFLSTPYTRIMMLGLWAPVLTIVWMVAITNAINLIDGLDGLASGITVIAGATLFVVALRTGQSDSALILSALVGASLGFLRFNFFPASIFLGDSGSLFLGFMLASASVVGVLKSTLVIALIIPIAVLGIPIYDTTAAIIRRAVSGRPIFEADKKHIHHRLLKAGFNQRQVVVIIYIACAILSLAALAATFFDNSPSLIILSIFVVVGILALDLAKDMLRNVTFLNGKKK